MKPKLLKKAMANLNAMTVTTMNENRGGQLDSVENQSSR